MIARSLAKITSINLQTVGCLRLSKGFSRNIVKKKMANQSSKPDDIDLLIKNTGIDTLLGQNEEKEEVARPLGSRLLEIMDKVDEKQCRGCGCKFQFERENFEGYIDLKRIQSEAKSTLNVEEIMAKLAGSANKPGFEGSAKQDGSLPYGVEDYLKEDVGLEGVAELEALFEEKIVKKDICDRCVLINHGEFDKLRQIEVNIESTPPCLARNTPRSFRLQYLQTDSEELSGAPRARHVGSRGQHPRGLLGQASGRWLRGLRRGQQDGHHGRYGLPGEIKRLGGQKITGTYA